MPEAPHPHGRSRPYAESLDRQCVVWETLILPIELIIGPRADTQP